MDSHENLTGERVRDMVTTKQVEKLFDITVEDTTAVEDENRAFAIASCSFDTAGNHSRSLVSVSATVSHQGVTGEQAVDEAFQSVESRKQYEYESVDGLGDTAGFGPEVRNADVEDNHVKLFAVDDTEDGGASYWVTVTVAKDAALRQPRPLAKDVLAQWRRV